jgi:hypothetical protein
MYRVVMSVRYMQVPKSSLDRVSWEGVRKKSKAEGRTDLSLPLLYPPPVQVKDADFIPILFLLASFLSSYKGALEHGGDLVSRLSPQFFPELRGVCGEKQHATLILTAVEPHGESMGQLHCVSRVVWTLLDADTVNEVLRLVVHFVQNVFLKVVGLYILTVTFPSLTSRPSKVR